MKKVLALLAIASMFAVAACNTTPKVEEEATPEETEEATPACGETPAEEVPAEVVAE
jgi:starvation-inducible outer membrane lipoprotein